jgi:hypothetical protein
LRAKSNDLESDYLDKKKHYDATMVGIDRWVWIFFYFFL